MKTPAPDGMRLATGMPTVKVWDTRTGTPNSGGLVTGIVGGIVSIWHTRTGTLLLEFKGHTDGVTSVAFRRGTCGH